MTPLKLILKLLKSLFWGVGPDWALNRALLSQVDHLVSDKGIVSVGAGIAASSKPPPVGLGRSRNTLNH